MVFKLYIQTLKLPLDHWFSVCVVLFMSGQNKYRSYSWNKRIIRGKCLKLTSETPFSAFLDRLINREGTSYSYVQWAFFRHSWFQRNYKDSWFLSFLKSFMILLSLVTIIYSAFIPEALRKESIQRNICIVIMTAAEKDDLNNTFSVITFNCKAPME